VKEKQMNTRFFSSTLTTAALAVLLAAPMFAQAPSSSKPPAAAVKSSIPRTADGHPDLSGVYSNVTTVPMTRPANCGDKEFYTAEDIANGLGGNRGCGGNAAGRGGGRGGAAAGGRGGAAAGRGAAANIDPETGQAALAVHYDTAQFGLSGTTMVRSSSMRTSIITGPEGQLPPRAPELAQRQAEITAARSHQWDGPETRPLGERCITWPSEGPPMMSAGYNADVQIVQGEGAVGIQQEMIHDTRMIPTNGGPDALPSGVPQWFGSSRGHWEGDKLVIVTTNYSGKTQIQGLPVSDKTKVTEKFSRIDADHVLYEFTVDDPLTWTKPWSGEVVWTKIDSPIYEYACQEGNYGMANNLSGQRASEKAAQQK
jgi:hypothetical protein